MRIRKVTLQNINSLSGRWMIDLTKPEFAENGFFTITGPTGVGKTTIFDAICIALFGKSPRLRNKSDKSSPKDLAEMVMTVGTAYSIAEVEFEAKQAGEENDRFFRCSWSCRRANDKPEGKVQDAVRSMAEIDSDGNTVREITQNSSDVNEQLKALIHIDADRFERGMMLAQGRFDTFLSSKGDEKAKLLEEMMGGKIYRTIGSKARRMCIDAKSKCDELERWLNDNPGKSKEEIVAVEQEIAHLGAWSKTLESLDKLGTDLDKNKAELEYTLGQEMTLVSALETSRQKEDEAKNKVAQAQNDKNSQTPLLDEVIAIDKDINAKKATVTQATQSRDQADRNLQAAQKETEATQNKCIEQERTIKAASAYVEEHRQDQQLSSYLRDWKSRAEIIGQEQNTLIDNKAKMESAQKDIDRYEKMAQQCEAELLRIAGDMRTYEDKLKRTQNEHEVISKGRSIGEWTDEKDKLAQRREILLSYINKLWEWPKLQKEWREAANTWAESQRNLATAEATSTQLQLDVDTATHNYNNALINDSNYKAIAALYDALKEGEPCAVCGALHHPKKKVATIIRPEVEKVNLQQALRAARTALDVAKKAQREFQDDQTKWQERQQQALKVQKDRKGKLDAIVTELQPCRVELSLPELSEATYNEWDQAIRQIGKEVKASIDAITERVKKISDIQNNCGGLKDELSQLQQIKATNDNKLTGLKQTIESEKNQLEKNRADSEREKQKIAEDLQNLSQELTPFALTVADLVAVQNNLGLLTKRSDTFAKYNDISESGQSKLKELLATLGEQENTVRNRREELERAQNDVIFRQQELEAVQSRRFDKLSADKEPQQELKRLNLACEQAQNDWSAAKIAYQKDEMNYQSWLKNVDDLRTKHSSLQEEQRNVATKVQEYSAAILGYDAPGILGADESWNELKALTASVEADINAYFATADNASALNYSAGLAKGSDEAATTEALLWNQQCGNVAILSSVCKQRQGRLQHTLDEASQLGAERQAKCEELELKKARFFRFKQLDEMIGGNNAGDKFVRYVQGLSFDVLLAQSNAHLAAFTHSRYLMKRKETESLQIVIVDGEAPHGYAERDAANLSGGERFLVSLSLALGLSALSLGQISIDSLFLDEGFGTLDEETLHNAVNCLINLHRTEGKLIGVISHVAELRDRNKIPLVIELVKKGDGRSAITPDSPGCQQLEPLVNKRATKKSKQANFNS